MTVARRVVEQAIGEQLDVTPLTPEHSRKNKSMAVKGKSGGKKGGRV